MLQRGRLYFLSALAIVFVLGLALAPTGSAHARAASKQEAKNAAASGSVINAIPEWVKEALPYVHVVNYTASIDPALAHVVSSQILAQVQQAVSRYNALPLAVKRSSGGAHPATAVSPAAGCQPQFREYINWWGYSFYLNHCLVYDIASGLTGGAALAGIVAALCGPCAPVAGTIAGVLVIYSAWLFWADSQCNGAGAYLNETSLVGSPVVWVSTAC
ncbi:hypothetical protein [Thermogemmatispora sp.]|uniref:hypothetical protein n=1 Tax=Thermogemmatispora sp. TaxID=1968838 RepID=UPI0035E462EF